MQVHIYAVAEAMSSTAAPHSTKHIIHEEGRLWALLDEGVDVAGAGAAVGVAAGVAVGAVTDVAGGGVLPAITRISYAQC